MERKEELVSKIKELFGARILSADLHLFDSIDSTNTEAKRRALADNVGRPSFFMALSQTAGRGRLGRSFLSQGGGLYLSYLFYPDMPCEDSILITVYAAVCVCETIEELCGVKPDIKWVNDVLLGGKKVAGILTEGKISESGNVFDYAVVGIGVNVAAVDFPSELSEIATDLESASGKRTSLAAFAVCLAEKLLAFDPSLARNYIERYKMRSAVIGREVRVISPVGEYSARVLDIDERGALIIERACGEREALVSGEISIRL